MLIPGPRWLRNGQAAAHTLVRILRGYRVFVRTGQTPLDASIGLRSLYCLTDGRFNDLMAAFICRQHPPRVPETASGVLGCLSRARVEELAAGIRDRGYCVFEVKLQQSQVDRLRRFALEHPARPMIVSRDEGLVPRFEYLPEQLYDPARLVSAKYDFDAQRVAENEDIQSLMVDETLWAVAGSYLRAEPVLALVAMWWSTDFLRGASSSAAAQHYHFDMDHLKFLKIFFYLTDVDSERGPHCYVARSHRRKPRQLLQDRRYRDEEIARTYPPEDVVEITGPSGTILAADTRAFHKGKPVAKGDRLLLQLVFAVSRFGDSNPRLRINDRFSEAFRNRVAACPRTLALFQA